MGNEKGSWQTVSIEDIKALTENALVTGPFGSSISSRYFVDSGIPVIRGSNLSQDVGVRLIDDGAVFVSTEKAKEFRRSIARHGDLVFTCWGTIDQVGLIDKRARFDEYVISNKQMKLTPDQSKADSEFLYYVFSSPLMRDRILSEGIGSSVPGFNLGQLRKLKLALPPLREQQAIACILGALDDKIELNRRRNETLEAMARAIFKSWFVDFDPVRAKTAGQSPPGLSPELAALFPSSFTDSPLGPIPKGWRLGSVGDNFQITMGQSPPGETYNELGDGMPFYQGRTDFGFRFPARRVCCTAPTRIAEAGDTLVSVRAPVGSVNIAIERCAVGRGVAAVRHLGGSRSLTYHAMHNLGSHFNKFEAEGTVFGSINKADFEKLPFLETSEDLLNAIEYVLAPIDNHVEVLERENATLVALRDALLPKLISGELRVPDAKRIVARAI